MTTEDFGQEATTLVRMADEVNEANNADVAIARAIVSIAYSAREIAGLLRERQAPLAGTSEEERRSWIADRRAAAGRIADAILSHGRGLDRDVSIRWSPEAIANLRDEWAEMIYAGLP